MLTEKTDKMIELYSLGLSHQKIADLMGYKCESSVGYHLRKLNIVARNNRDKTKIYKFDENFFEIIDSEEKAYWLGFLYADGFINSSRKHNSRKMGISISSIDREHLVKLNESLKSNVIIRDYKTSGGYSLDTQYSRLIFSSEKMCSDLVDKGMFEKKSLILCFPNERQVSKALQCHFIRGYFDGDGSISISGNEYKFRICGTKELLTSIQEILGVTNMLQKRKKDDSNNYSIDFGGNNKVLLNLKKLYDQSHIHLDRKYVRFSSLVEKQAILNR